jgi:hypothetical protein
MIQTLGARSPGLTLLGLDSCSLVTTKALDLIALHCQKLEALTMYECSDPGAFQVIAEDASKFKSLAYRAFHSA